MNKLMPTLFFMTITMGIFLSSTVVSAESKTTTASVTVPEACTMTSNNDTPHVATLSPNTYSGAPGSEYENGIGKTTLTAICNDDNGFSIYAIGYTGNSYDSENHTKLVGNNLGGTITTKAYASGDTASNWSMKLTKVTDSTVSYNPQNLTITNSYDSWNIIPNTYTKVAEYHANTGSSTTDTTLGAKLETTYAAFIAQNQPADTYVGQVKYTMVHPYNNEPIQPRPTVAGKICYYANAYDSEGTMGCQNVSSSATSATLFASNFSRTGYGFAGWSNHFDYATNSEANFYGPNETISFTAGQYTDDNPGLSLYAIWAKSAGDFQDSSKVSQLCDANTGSLTTVNYDTTTGALSADLSTISALTDIRDNQTYAIAKLADGNCWMIENLRLDNTAKLTTLNTNNPLNNNDSPNPTTTLKHNYSDTETYDTLSATSNTAYNADTAPDGWCDENSASCVDQSRLRTDNTANRIVYTAEQSMSSRAVNLYSYGNYYNWYSATAGRGIYDISNNNAVGDLCPLGWKLPYGNTGSSGANLGGTSGGLSYLDKAMGGTGGGGSTNAITGKSMSIYWRSFPNNHVYSGYVVGSSIEYRGSINISWSSTSYGRGGVHPLFINPNELRPGTLNSYNNDKSDGKTLRCVAIPQ